MSNRGKVLIFFVVFFSPLPTITVVFSTGMQESLENYVTISQSNGMIVVSTDFYKFSFDSNSTYWNATAGESDGPALKNVKWKLFYNGTDIESNSLKYNPPEGEAFLSHSTFEDGIFFNFTSSSISEAPSVMEYFWFYPKFFVIQMNVTNTILGESIFIEKAEYINSASSKMTVGEPNNTNFVFWGYKGRHQAQEIVDNEPPAFIYNNKTNAGLVMAQLKPNWSHRVRSSYISSSSGFYVTYELNADTNNADNIAIATNAGVSFDKVFFQFTSSDINQAFVDYASLYSSLYTLRSYKGSQTYWLTWYADGDGISQGSPNEANVLSNATWIENNLRTYYGFDGVLVDAMISDEIGDWLNYSTTRFPSGMRGLVEKIHEKGLKVGLWIAPLAVEKGGWVNKTHPDSLARNKTGDPLISRIYLGGVERDFYYLNPFDPWVRSRLRRVNKNISSWNFDFVKMDFLAGVLHELYVPNQTRYMIMEETFKAVVDGLDDRIAVIGCIGRFYNPAMVVNYVDRIWLYGNDLWNSWAHLNFKYDVLTQLTPFIRHFNTTIDSDALGYRLINPHVPTYIAQFYSAYATVGGSTFEISERLATIDRKRLAIYKRYLPFVPKKWRPIEWTYITSTRPPRIWLYNTTLDGKHYYYLALFNVENTTKLFNINLTTYTDYSNGTFLVLNQFNSSLLGEYGPSFDIYLNANQTMVLILTQKDPHAAFLMRSDHVTASAEFIHVSSATSLLTVILHGSRETNTSMTIFSPTEPMYIQKNDSFVPRLSNTSYFEGSANAGWRYDSARGLLLVRFNHTSQTTRLRVSWIDDTLPIVWEVRRSLQYPEYFQNVTITAKVTEHVSRIDKVILGYHETEWHNLTMNPKDHGLFEAKIPSYRYGNVINYLVYVNDTWGNAATSDMFYYVVSDTVAPQIVWVHGNIPEYSEPAIILANITEPEDASGLLNVILSYSNGSLWHNLTMSLVEGLYRAEIPAHPFNVTVQYRILASDSAGSTVVSNMFLYRVIDSFSPEISSTIQDPPAPNVEEDVFVWVNVTEPKEASQIEKVILYYSINGTSWFETEMTPNRGLYAAAIPKQHSESRVEYFVVAFDNVGNYASTSIYSYVPKRSTFIDYQSVLIFVVVGMCLIVSALVLVCIVFLRKRHDNFMTSRKILLFCASESHETRHMYSVTYDFDRRIRSYNPSSSRLQQGPPPRLILNIPINSFP